MDDFWSIYWAVTLWVGVVILAIRSVVEFIKSWVSRQDENHSMLYAIVMVLVLIQLGVIQL